jgi:hypothetical protein
VIYGFEILLVLGALAFYVHDSCALLFADELVLERVGHRWRAHAGVSSLISGKRPFVPNPMAPYRPLMRVSLGSLLADKRVGRADYAHFLNALAPFQMLSTCLLVLFFPVLPLVLFGFGTGAELLGWLVTVYAAVACIIYSMFRRRRVLELSHRELGLLAFEFVSCAPYAINVVRKLTLRVEAVTLAAAATTFDPHSVRALRAAGDARIDEMLHSWEPGTPQSDSLLDYRERLATGCRTE